MVIMQKKYKIILKEYIIAKKTNDISGSDKKQECK